MALPYTTGLTLWLDASQITGVADGATLATWPDMSGNGYNATQATAGNDPLYYKTTASKLVNGLPAVWLTNGTTDYMATGAFAAALTTGTVFAVGAITDTGNNGILYDGIAGGNRWTMSGDGSGDIDMFQGIVLAWAQAVPTGVHQWTAQFLGTASSFARQDGVLVATGNAGADTLTGVTLGQSPTGTQQDTGAIFCELLIYSPPLTGAQIASVESYLHQKWFVPPASGGALLLGAPGVMPATVAGVRSAILGRGSWVRP